MCRDTAWFLCDRSSAIALMRALVMTSSCYGALEIVCVLLLVLVDTKDTEELNMSRHDRWSCTPGLQAIIVCSHPHMKPVMQRAWLCSSPATDRRLWPDQSRYTMSKPIKSTLQWRPTINRNYQQSHESASVFKWRRTADRKQIFRQSWQRPSLMSVKRSSSLSSSLSSSSLSSAAESQDDDNFRLWTPYVDSSRRLFSSCWLSNKPIPSSRWPQKTSWIIQQNVIHSDHHISAELRCRSVTSNSRLMQNTEPSPQSITWLILTKLNTTKPTTTKKF